MKPGATRRGMKARDVITVLLVAACVFFSCVAAVAGDYDRAAWMSSVATFLVVTDRSRP